MSASTDKFADLNLTQDELKRFSEAMKKEEFRKLLIDYAEELQDPKNRQLYESEITKLENERGMNVLFIHPEPGFCLKTTQTKTRTTDKGLIFGKHFNYENLFRRLIPWPANIWHEFS